MAITDPRAIKFANEQVRPLAEKLRAIVAEVGALQTDWFSGTNSLFTNDATLVDDGRDAEGISRLTGQDVNSLVNIALAMASASNSQIVAKPCVRALTVG